MKIDRTLTAGVTLAGALALSACQNMEGLAPWIDAGNQAAKNAGYDTDSRLGEAVRKTLSLSSERATDNLSRSGAWQLPLPDSAERAANALETVGLGRYVDQVRDAMDQGAARAAAEAAPVFQQAVQELTIQDALGIVGGEDTAATEYFQGRTESTLRERYAPVVKSSLEETGFYDQYRTLLDAYERLPMSDKPDLDLERYVIDTSLARLFSEIGAQEALIREDPVGRGGALIGAVFGDSDG